jgi:hypothetical protein
MSAGNGKPFQPDFVAIPYVVFSDPGLSHAAKLTYGRLKLYAGEDGRAFPKHETLAEEVCLRPRQLKNVLVELRAAGWIGWTRARASCLYTVFSDRQKIAHHIGKKLPIRQAENCPSREARNCLQKRSIEDHHQKEKSEKKPRPRVNGSTAGEAPKETPKAKTDSLNADDDKNCFPPESPEARLKAWAVNRGDPLSLKDWWDIKAQAEVRGLALGELADLAEKNNGHWKSSAAGLRWLLKQFARKTTDAPAEVVTPQPVEKCPKCRCPKGQGTVLVNGHLEACECATAEWRRQIAQAAARDAANGSNAIKPVAEVLQHPVPTEVAE